MYRLHKNENHISNYSSRSKGGVSQLQELRKFWQKKQLLSFSVVGPELWRSIHCTATKLSHLQMLQCFHLKCSSINLWHLSNMVNTMPSSHFLLLVSQEHCWNKVGWDMLLVCAQRKHHVRAKTKCQITRDSPRKRGHSATHAGWLTADLWQVQYRHTTSSLAA